MEMLHKNWNWIFILINNKECQFITKCKGYGVIAVKLQM